MDDLIEKLFKKDLTEDEKAALSQAILSSEETAEKVGAKFEAAYRRFGLPDPQWTGPDELPRRRKHNYDLWVLALLLLSGIGVSTWWFLKQNISVETPLPVSSNHLEIPTPKSTPKLPKPETNASQNHFTGKTDEPKGVPPVATRKAAVPFSVSKNPPTSTPEPFHPKFTPVNSDKNPGGSFSSLSVVLRRPTAGYLAVRVLDSAGTEITPLFKGNLAPGTWTFEWDGLRKDGKVASPGTYKIEVRAGSWVKTQEVVIQK